MEINLNHIKLDHWRRLVNVLCVLDTEQDAGLGINDYRGLACQLLPWITMDQMERQRNHQCPTEVILKAWKQSDTNPTLEKLICALNSIKRYDVLAELKEHVLPVLQKPVGRVFSDSQGDHSESADTDSMAASYLTTTSEIIARNGFSDDVQSKESIHMNLLNFESGVDMAAADSESRWAMSPDSPVPEYSVMSRYIDPRREALQLLRNMTYSESWRLDDQMCFFIAMFVMSIWGIVCTIHQIMRSRFYDPIDRSTWSAVFYALSCGKECSVYVLLVSAAYYFIRPELFMQLHTAGHWILVHCYLMLLLLIQICHDKTVSPVAIEMRSHYLHFLRVNNGNYPVDQLKRLRWEIERRQQRCRSILQVFTYGEAILAIFMYVQTDVEEYWSQNKFDHLLVTVQCLVAAWLVAGWASKIIVYIFHYRRPRLELLDGRFDTQEAGAVGNIRASLVLDI